MISIADRPIRLCDGIDRREWLRLGGAAAVSLPTLLHAQRTAAASGDSSFGRAKRCILFFLTGGPPQYETWDPKPEAPVEVRGPFKPIASSVPGLQVCELMPRVAKLAHLCGVLRAASTGDNAHSSSGYYVMTGQPHQPLNRESAMPKAPNDWPNIGAVVTHLRGSPGRLPGAVTIPEDIVNDGNFPWPGQNAGWLGRKADPWLVHCQPNEPGFNVPSLALASDTPSPRFADRRSLLERVNGGLDTLSRSAEAELYDDQVRQAVDLVSSSAARAAFELDREPAKLRERYGRHRWGQSVLLARRLVEAGVSLVQINWTRIKGKENQGGWDTHAKNAESLKSFLMPMMDESFSALLEDLQLRGMLDDTLVVWLGEFGRTPRHNGNAGRDHWGPVFSLALAGGGVRGGTVHGASDRQGAYPKDGRVTPADLHATIFHLLGIGPHSELRDPLGRPVPACRGSVIRQVL